LASHITKHPMHTRNVSGPEISGPSFLHVFSFFYAHFYERYFL
jgi:hypothetical protein